MPDVFSVFPLRAGLVALSLLPAAAFAQTVPKLVDVKNASSVSRFSMHTNGALLAGGDYDGGATYEGYSPIPAEGAGTRLMWYPGKAAFRAGYVNGTLWDDANIGGYSVALGHNVRASADYSVAMGTNTIAAQNSSFAMGQYCIATGAASVALGNCAHTNARQGSFVFADRTVQDDGDGSTETDEYFKAPVNHSASWRVLGGFRVVTGGGLMDANGNSDLDYVPTRGVSILPATTTLGSGTTNWGQTTALIATSSGAYLSDGGIWTNTSDRRKKHLFEPVSGEDVLARLRRVPLTSWSYKTDPATVRHLGPMAQDFRAAFGLGADSVSIGTVDADGVALAGVQALDARTLGQEKQLAGLQAENQALRARLDALERPVGTKSSGSLSLTVALLLVGTGVGAVLLRRR